MVDPIQSRPPRVVRTTPVSAVEDERIPEVPSIFANSVLPTRDAALGPPVHPAHGARDPGAGPVGLRLREASDFQRAVEDLEAQLAAGPVLDRDRRAARLLRLAREHLDRSGAPYREHVSQEGYPALLIEPRRGLSLLNEPASDLEENLAGFRLLYSPAKLLRDAIRGENSRYRREVFMSHRSLIEAKLDPITIHEIEHTVLSRCEEKGIPTLFTGNVNSFNGKPVSNFAPEVGGYFWSLSFQEVSAYSIQCEMLARRLESDADLDWVLPELRDMARWGWALSGRVADVAERTVTHIERDPKEAVFEQLTLTRQGEEGREVSAGPAVVWAKTANLPDLCPQVPLPGASVLADFEARQRAAPEAWDHAHTRLAGHMIAHFSELRAATRQLSKEFRDVYDLASALAERAHVEPDARDQLRALVTQMRTTTTRRAEDYRAARLR